MKAASQAFAKWKRVTPSERGKLLLKIADELESRAESFGGLQSATIVAVLGIIAILVLEFGSFKSTLIVLTVVPFGIAGGIIMRALTGNSISFTATVGFIALIRIETKNSILLVDFTNRLRAEGMPLDEAIELAQVFDEIRGQVEVHRRLL